MQVRYSAENNGCPFSVLLRRLAILQGSCRLRSSEASPLARRTGATIESLPFARRKAVPVPHGTKPLFPLFPSQNRTPFPPPSPLFSPLSSAIALAISRIVLSRFSGYPLGRVWRRRRRRRGGITEDGLLNGPRWRHLRRGLSLCSLRSNYYLLPRHLVLIWRLFRI